MDVDRQSLIEQLCNDWGADEVLRRVAGTIDDAAGSMEYHAGSRVAGIAWRIEKIANEVMRDAALKNCGLTDGVESAAEQGGAA